MPCPYIKLAVLSAALALAACSKTEEAPSPTGTAPASAPADPASAPANYQGANGLLTAAAPTTPTCQGPIAMDVEWNAPGVEGAQLFVGEGADAKLFAAGGNTSKGPTGPWVRPGTVFVLRNAADDSELDRLVVPGDACPPAENQ